MDDACLGVFVLVERQFVDEAIIQCSYCTFRLISTVTIPLPLLLLYSSHYYIVLPAFHSYREADDRVAAVNVDDDLGEDETLP